MNYFSTRFISIPPLSMIYDGIAKLSRQNLMQMKSQGCLPYIELNLDQSLYMSCQEQFFSGRRENGCGLDQFGNYSAEESKRLRNTICRALWVQVLKKQEK